MAKLTSRFLIHSDRAGMPSIKSIRAAFVTSIAIFFKLCHFIFENNQRSIDREPLPFITITIRIERSITKYSTPSPFFFLTNSLPTRQMHAEESSVKMMIGPRRFFPRSRATTQYFLTDQLIINQAMPGIFFVFNCSIFFDTYASA